MAVHLADHALKSLTAECFEYLLIIDSIRVDCLGIARQIVDISLALYLYVIIYLSSFSKAHSLLVQSLPQPPGRAWCQINWQLVRWRAVGGGQQPAARTQAAGRHSSPDLRVVQSPLPQLRSPVYNSGVLFRRVERFKFPLVC